jgi:ribosomal protein S27AE
MNKNETAKTSAGGCSICPRCGSNMNRHAEKPDYSADPSSPSFDPVLGAALMEFHTCPRCTYVLERGAQAGPGRDHRSP